MQNCTTSQEVYTVCHSLPQVHSSVKAQLGNEGRERTIPMNIGEVTGAFPVLAYLFDWGWLRIGPPYVYINIDPVIVHLGPLALRWYGLMYVVGIIMGLWAIRGYTTRKGIHEYLVYRVLWWCIGAGLLGGRLYFVIQQPNFFSYYLVQPQHILATWEGGMAFFGAIFLVIPTLLWRARIERVNPLVLIDAGVLLAAVGQIFLRELRQWIMKKL